MKRYFLYLFAVAGVLASCAKDPAVFGDDRNGGNDRTEEDYCGDVVKGKIRIRLTDDAMALRTGAFTRGEADSVIPRSTSWPHGWGLPASNMFSVPIPGLPSGIRNTVCICGTT